MNPFGDDGRHPQPVPWSKDYTGNVYEPVRHEDSATEATDPAPGVDEAIYSEVPAMLSDVNEISPTAAAAVADSIVQAGSATASARTNHGEVNAVKVVNYLQESLEQLKANEEFLDRVLELFAPPEDFASHYHHWLESHLLVIALNQDQGRFITAHALLAKIRKDQKISVGALSFGGGSTFPVGRLPHARNWAYVVEVPAEEDEFKLRSSFGSSLNTLQDRLRQQSCWMVLVMAADQWDRARAQAPGITELRESHVTPEAIVRRALLARDKQIPVDRWLEDPRVQKLIAEQPPAQAQEVVDLIFAAQQLTNPESEGHRSAGTRTSGASQLLDSSDSTFERQVEMVIAARTNWRKQLLHWHRKEGRTGFQRNFLISAAVQNGVPVAHVYLGATELARALQEKKLHAPAGQNAPGVIDLVDAVHADLTEQNTVVFDRLGWDDAALQYFWIDRPLSRGLFIGWLAKRAVQTQQRESFEPLTEVQRRALASRIAQLAVDWAVRLGRLHPLKRIAEEWYDQGTVWSEFVDVLDHAAVQPSTARNIHPMLLNWANVPPAVKQPGKLAVAEICAGQFGRKYTGKALIRLKHAANSDDPRVIEAVQAGVQTLWEDRSVRDALFAAVTGWCKDEKTAAAGRQSFFTLARHDTRTDDRRPRLLIEPDTDDDRSGPDDEDLSYGWRGLLAPDNSDERLEEVLFFWLDAALAFPEYEGRIVKVLCGAVRGPEVAGRESPRNRLTGLARLWSKQAMDDAQRREHVYNTLTGRVDDEFIARRPSTSASFE
ncbi:hypothetical protein [Labedaea rhizosphaerae]|uniref:Uncharacterized protein n=1 Tax=Labedaea rhizosphaerae TaxID=598644 RepID=A0A4V3CZI3_LABRH|nr:hypothetical protein [Labedaea rhizosphaerae]TDP98148.1 hypothetical protein EV186_1031128 [Labedaea rhizosphaerae]